MAKSQWVVDVTEENFQELVLERSRTVPVVVDFWAPWCGPCRSLGPMLEEQAEKGNGSFLLAKINTDENQNLAAAFRVEGIPAVYALRDATVIDGFVGLLPEEQLEEFLRRIVPSESDRLVNQARELETTDPAAAETHYRTILKTEPANDAAKIGLARVLLARPGTDREASALIRLIESGDFATEADRLRAILELREQPHDDSTLNQVRVLADAQSSNTAVLMQLGAILAARGSYLEALDTLIAAARLDKSLAKGAARELMLKIFQVIGVRSEISDDYRAKLQAILY